MPAGSNVLARPEEASVGKTMTQVQPDPALYRKLRWLLVPMTAAHNFEEWLTFPRDGPISWPALQLGLFLVTIIPAMVVIWAASGRPRWWKDFAVLVVASIYLANVFLPHVPAAIVAKGYAPGVITAVAVNLPFVLFLLWTAAREAVLPVKGVVLAAVTGFVALPPSLFAVIALSRQVTG